jgi:hypothetical protein
MHDVLPLPHTPRVTVRHAVVGLGCYAMHQLLAYQYHETCRSWMTPFNIESSPFCAILKKGMSVLQWSPLGLFLN